MGFLVIGLVAFVTILGRAIQPGVAAGTAVPAPAPAPPAIGSCLQGAVDPSWIDTAASSSAALDGYRLAEMGSCIGNHYGEVVGLIQNPAGLTVVSGRQSDNAARLAVAANLDECSVKAAQYLGLAASGKLQTIVQSYWLPTASYGSTAFAPSKSQRAAGQRWLACVVFLQPASWSISGSTVSEELAKQERYAGSLRGALQNGRQRDRLGVCDGGCGNVHDSEVFAKGTTGQQAVDRRILQASCVTLIQQVTGLPDITAGGELEVEVTTIEGGVWISLQRVPATTDLTCQLRSAQGRELNGSLRALGSGPLPWTTT